MITFFVTAQHSYTIRPLLDSWIDVGMPSIDIVAYSALHERSRLELGAFIFSDLERLTPAQSGIAAALWQRLSAAGNSVRLLNHPTRALRRFDLLARLHTAGINSFRAFRVGDGWQNWKYPVFLREESEHTGSLSNLLPDATALRGRMLELLLAGYDPGKLMVVEFCDTADAQGVYRKYSAFRVGDHILPRHVLFSRHWVLKDQDLLDERHRTEVRDYCRSNPHEHQLMDIFELARVDFGRIDYSLLNGAIQVWEINTNPVVIKARHKYSRDSRPFHEGFLRELGDTLRSLAGETGGGVRLSWDEIDPMNPTAAGSTPAEEFPGAEPAVQKKLSPR